MKYVSLDMLQSKLSEGPRLAVLQGGPVRGRETSKDEHTTTDFDEAIDCRICRPKLIPISNSKVGILRVGFRISLNENIRLQWARFRLLFSSEGVEISSLFPRCVTRPEAFKGRIAVGDHDELSWTPIEADETEFSATDFTPSVFGYRLDAASVFWDFLPWNWQEPPGTDSLVLALRMKFHVKLHLSARVFLNVVHRDYGEAHLEMPAKTFEIKQ
jgi:hypothetical protein